MAALIKPLLSAILLCILEGNCALPSGNAIPEIIRDFDSKHGSSKDTKHLSDAGKYPFVAYWNAPCYDCLHIFNVDFHLDKYGIIANTGQNFTGDEIVTFNEDELGYYPHYNKNSQPVNGGLPQVANLSAHLEKATEEVLKVIPDPHFKGIGIIDWESWRPQWEQNFDSRQIYREKSIDLVYKRHPEWTNETIELVATLEFEQAAENWMKSTLRLVKDLRPNARWGFYHFPYCYNKKDVCTQEAVLTNNNIMWLFDHSTALYPSILLPQSQEQKDDFVHAQVSEALRVRNNSGNQFVDIYPYTGYVYPPSVEFLSKEDLNSTILQSAEMGSSGVVFWGSGYDTHTAESCQRIQEYVNSTLGPFVKKVTDASTLCSAEICSGNGRCVGKIFECTDLLRKRKEESVNELVPREWRQQTLMPCSCQCYKGWKGFFCDQF